MVRPFRINRSKFKFPFASRGAALLLAVCFVNVQPDPAHAIPRIIAGLMNEAPENTDLMRIGVCGDGTRACSDHARHPAAPEPEAYASRWEAYPPPPAPHAGRAAPRQSYELPPHIEPLPPCEPVEYAARGYVHGVRPLPPESYADDYDNSCGVRCWYRRLRYGYCGRGCDYYRYRLYDYPTGSLRRYGSPRFACRSEY